METINPSPLILSQAQGGRWEMQIGQEVADVTWTFEVASEPESDTAFLLLIAQGDTRAMHMLFTRHKLRVYRYALRLTNDDAAAQDLVNDVFLAVWRQAGRFEGRSQVSTWLLAIARNLATAALRRRPTESLDCSVMDSVADHADDPEVTVSKLQESSILAACLNKLSPPHREIIDLVYYHEKSVTEAAEIIGIPRSTVKTRMFYARNAIADLLKQRGVEWDRQRGNPRSPCFAH
jgi:RNA polymerase sigma-70 factor, ECF subfamily